MITLMAPKGVTKMAGAKVYAAKFATAPYQLMFPGSDGQQLADLLRRSL
jgi:hypothetical protein